MSKGQLWRRHMIVELRKDGGTVAKYEYPPWGIELDVLLDVSAQANSARVKLYNLSKKTIGKLRRGMPVLVAAGYEGDEIGDLFLGVLDKYETKFDRVDKVTTLHLIDGRDTVLATRPNISWRPGVSASRIIRDLFQAAGITPKKIQLKKDIKFSKGKLADPSGTVKDWLNQIRDDVNSVSGAEHEWFVDMRGNGYFVPRTVTIPGRVVRLEPKKGLIDSPEPLKTVTADVAATDAEPRQWRIRAVLNWRLYPGGKIEVRSSKVEGTFKVVRVRHVGTPNRQFESQVTADELSVRLKEAEEG